MLSYNNYNSYPYTPSKLKYFAEEIKQAGGFKNLMVIKEAIKKKNALQYSIVYHYPITYQEKYLGDVYKSLRPLFKTEAPYTFWNEMYQKLKSVDTGKINL